MKTVVLFICLAGDEDKHRSRSMEIQQVSWIVCGEEVGEYNNL